MVLLGLKETWNKIRQSFYDDFTVISLKTMIVVWAIGVILLVVFVVNDKWLLASILAYEVLP